MSRLINADMLDSVVLRLNAKGAQITRSEYKLIDRVIFEFPTVDAEPVIRCKYCIHFDGYYCHNKNWGDGYGNYPPPIKSEDGFCDWVDRKEERK